VYLRADVAAQELASEGGVAALSGATLERALVSRLEAPPTDARDSPFQYLLGCAPPAPMPRQRSGVAKHLC